MFSVYCSFCGAFILDTKMITDTEVHLIRRHVNNQHAGVLRPVALDDHLGTVLTYIDVKTLDGPKVRE